MAITASQAQGLVLALFGASAGAHLTGLTSAASVSAEAADLVTAAGLVLDQDLSSNATFRDLVLVTNLKLTGTALTAAQAWMDGEFTKGTARGDIIAAAVTFLDGLTDTTNTFYATAAAYRTTVANAVTWSQGAGATVTSVATLMAQQGTASNAQGQTFTLTTGTDTLVGTTGNDTFTGTIATYGANDQVIDASASDNDTYNLTLDASQTVKAVNVENINVTIQSTDNTAGNIQLTASSLSGVKNLTVSRGDLSVGGSTILGGKLVEVVSLDASKVAQVTVGAGTTNATVNQTSKAGVVVAADAASGNVTVVGASTVKAAGAGANKTVTVTGFDGSATGAATENGKAVTVTTGAQTVSIADGANSGKFTGVISVTAAAAKSVTIANASGGATVAALGGKSTDGISISGIADSGATVTTTYVGTKTSATDASGVVSLTGSSGTADKATVNADGVVALTLTNLANVTLGGNVAAVTYNVGTVGTKTTLIGTQDVTVADSAENFGGKTLVDSTTAGTTTAKLDAGVNSAARDLSKVAADKIVIAADMGTTTTNKITLATGANVVLQADQASALALDAKTAAGTLNLSTADDTAASGATIDLVVGSTFTAGANVTTLNLDATVGKFTATTGVTMSAVDTSSAAAGALVITGTKDVALGTVDMKSIDASTSSGRISLTSATTKAITTGGADDTLTFSGTVKYTVDAGNGANTLNINTAAGAAADGSYFVTGTGDDTIAVGRTGTAPGKIVLATGAGNDSITLNAATDGVFALGDGSDTFTLGNTADVSSTTSFANFAVTGVETVALSSNNLTENSAQFANDNAFALTGSGAFKVVGASSTAANTIDASAVTRAASVTATVTLEGNAKADTITGTAGADTIIATAGADTLTGGSGTDTVSYSGTYGGNTFGSSTLEGTGTGTQAGVVVNLGSTAITATSVLSKTGYYTADANTTVAAGSAAWLYSSSASTNSAVVQTLSGIENITGSTGKDYLVGTATDNVIVGGAGGDYINVGLGTDTVKFTAAAETFAGAITSGTTVLTGVDVVAGMGAGDKVDISALGTFTAAAAATVVLTAVMTAGTNGDVAVVRGDFNASTGVWTTSGTGADTLVQWDSNGVTNGGNVESIVLVGVNATSSTVAAGILTVA